jgi:UDP-3-O-[3-hydroxymyristoyl] glucosamine N-acyltransferase
VKLQEIAERLGLELEGDGSLEIRGLARLEDAGPADLSFVSGPRYQRACSASHAGALLAPPGLDVAGRPCLRSPGPYAAFARAIELLYPRRPWEPGVHPTAAVDASAQLGEGVSIGPYAVVGARARVGARTRLHPHVTVYPDVEIGADCEIHSGAHLHEAVSLGDRVVVHSGAVIGSEGFGFAEGPDGARVRIPHRTGVAIGDDCQIGANSTVDASHPAHPRRGHAVARTRLGRGVVVDNLVQIGHGCDIGDGSTVCALVGLAGSTEVGRGVTFGGQSATAGHLRVGDYSLVGGRAGVHGDLPPRSQVLGFMAMERRLFGKVTAALKRLPELLARVRRLEQHLGLHDEDPR